MKITFSGNWHRHLLEEWGKIFADDVVAAAILDRLLHHCYPFFIQGKSYRLKEMMGKKKEQ